MRAVFSKFLRVAGATGLVGAMLLGPLGTNAGAVDLASFTGASSSFALRVVVDASGLVSVVPAGAVKDALDTALEAAGAEGGKFDVTLVSTDGTIDQTPLAQVSAALVKGLAAVEALGANEASASLSGQHSTNSGLGTQNFPGAIDGVGTFNLLTINAGELAATVTEAPSAVGNGKIGPVVASVKPLAGELPTEVTDALQLAIDTVNATLDAAQAAVIGAIQDAADTVDELTGLLGEELPTGTTAQDIVDAVAEFEVPDVPNPLTVDSILSVAAPTSDVSVSKTDLAGVVSTSSSSLGTVSIFDGLVSVDAVRMSALAQAAGSPETAAADAVCTPVNLRLGDEDAVSLDGGTLWVAGVPIATPADLVDDVKAAVDELTEAAGIEISAGDICPTTKSRAEDGTSASATAELLPISVTLNTPDEVATALETLEVDVPETLLSVMVDPAVTASVQAQPQVTSPAALPRTGAPIVATVLSGMALLGGALVIRRKLV